MGVADVGGPPAAALAFENDVRKLSKGSLLVATRLPKQQTADGEPMVLRAVAQGAVPMGWIPTRAWDAVGVPTFSALQAPFLVTSYEVLKQVLEGPVGRRMIGGTRVSGVRTLGLAAVDLHVPLGARRPYSSPSDFRGATFRVPSNSTLTEQILQALGGQAVGIASGSDLFAALQSGGVDGAITSPLYVLRNGYYGAAKYLTTNLVFFPYVGTIGLNERVFESLPPDQQSVLTRSGAEMTQQSFVGLRARDQQELQFLCKTGVRLASSTAMQLAGLQRAVRSVYSSLEARRPTAEEIAGITSLKAKLRPAPPLRIPTGCAA